ncbi:asparagine synthase (glutamine-hydrolyzing) [Vibrio vulnificus]|nr:asparagine synthase (glutamine-hydrolyzing) [Vibrio vulnificus]EKA7352083.1 asparagine synthase (glutamine-hydrolyzing) [Vibrio vulnificus]ELM6648973.1 asparagine synthase (glutamine-hydrolyzing) [Vibrio vulnificus]MCU8220940.1 asparagine synthase (glutamine-hydrolyzing) [Vibrio vulnificus]
MCGIAGFVGKPLSDSDSIINAMTSVLAHRGPDGFGHFIESGIALGHTRLSIVDLSDAGHQPMHFKGRYVITYNGEVYNHVEIRSELEKHGYCFHSHTDTEVIMAAYDMWGAECVKKFNGMWAFCIYDKQTDTFFLSRDRFGIKPLYYYSDGETFVFSSEVKSILEHPAVLAVPNKPYLDEYVAGRATEHLRETPFKNIYRFAFSCYAQVTRKELLTGFKEKVFWSVTANTSKEKFDKEKAQEYADKYYSILEDSVRVRLRADVKIGSALSGGLDSSSIVYLVNQQLKEQGKEELQETFSSVYKAKGTEDCDESTYIDMLAKELNVNTNQIEPIAEEIPVHHSNMIKSMESPPDNTCMSGWHTFKKVAETNVKVTLDGQGADEQLAGYLYYYFIYFAGLPLTRIIPEIFNSISTPGVFKHILGGTLVNLMSKICGKKFTKNFVAKRNLITNFDFDLNEVLIKDLNTDLITLIHYSDRVSMAHSIESRMPFMDYRLIEFLATVPACYKLRKGWTKYLARLAFDKKLPDEIVWRKDKMGWPIPEAHWFYKTLSGWVLEKLSSNQSLEEHFDLEQLKSNFKQKEQLSSTVKALNVAVWYSTFFNTNGQK